MRAGDNPGVAVAIDIKCPPQFPLPDCKVYEKLILDALGASQTNTAQAPVSGARIGHMINIRRPMRFHPTKWEDDSPGAEFCHLLDKLLKEAGCVTECGYQKYGYGFPYSAMDSYVQDIHHDDTVGTILVEKVSRDHGSLVQAANFIVNSLFFRSHRFTTKVVSLLRRIDGPPTPFGTTRCERCVDTQTGLAYDIDSSPAGMDIRFHYAIRKPLSLLGVDDWKELASMRIHREIIPV